MAPSTYRRHTVAAVAQHDTHPFELSVACEVFGLERPELGVPWYRFVVVAAEEPPVRVRNFTLETPHRLGALRTADTIIVRSGSPIASRRPRSSTPFALRNAAARASFPIAAAPSCSRRPACSITAERRRTGCTRPSSRSDTR
jgi:AraC family transcriptional regulator, transcriptional activator FtrA